MKSAFDMDYPEPERDCMPLHDREGRQVYGGYWIFYDRDGSVSFGTETHEYFGSLPAEIVRAVPESSPTPLRRCPWSLSSGVMSITGVQ